MAKIRRFPLEMENGVEVRDIASLKNNFSLPRVVEYMRAGKLVTWLRDHYCEELAEEIEKIDVDDAELANKICEVFGIEYSSSLQKDMEKAAEREKRKERLREYTDNPDFFENIDDVAFDQDELYDLLDEEKATIYLCGESFFIPIEMKNKTYVGINDPEIVVDSDKEIDFLANNIAFINTHFCSKYANLLEELEEQKAEIAEDSMDLCCEYVIEDTNVGCFRARRIYKDLETKIQVPIPEDESVMDYCFSDKYLYIVTQDAHEYIGGEIQDTNNAKLYRVEKNTDEIELLKSGFRYGIPSNDNSFNSFRGLFGVPDTKFIVCLDDVKPQYLSSCSGNMICNDKYVAISKFENGSNIKECNSFVYCSEKGTISEIPAALLICMFNDSIFMTDFRDISISGIININLLSDKFTRIFDRVDKFFFSIKNRYMIIYRHTNWAEKYLFTLLDLNNNKTIELLEAKGKFYFDTAYIEDGRLILRINETKYNEENKEFETIYYKLAAFTAGKNIISEKEIESLCTYYLPNGEQITKDDALKMAWGGLDLSIFKKK